MSQASSSASASRNSSGKTPALFKGFAALWQARPVAILATGGFVLLFIAYTTVFAMTGGSPFSENLFAAARNTIPAAALAVCIHLILERFVIPRPLWVHLLVHVPLGLAFAVVWYIAILFVLGANADWMTEGLAIRPFPYVAFVWQMFQGVTLYAVIAIFTYAVHFRRELTALKAAQAHAPDAPKRQAATTLLVRRDDEIVSVPHADIIRITGAGDYAEVITARGKSLSTTTLTEFETMLPEERFVRIHRSHIVNLEAVTAAEPAGNGRLSLHLKDGTSLVASRTGARRFRAVTV